jgi:hypothetical protein
LNYHVGLAIGVLEDGHFREAPLLKQTNSRLRRETAMMVVARVIRASSEQHIDIVI